MIGIKLAIINLIRIPKRTIINLFLLLLIFASVTSGILVYTATEKALVNLDENYTFVASMVSSKPLEYANGDLISTMAEAPDYMRFDDFRRCIRGADILAYNVFMNDRILFVPPEGKLYDFPEENGSALDVMVNPYMDCYLYPTNNLFLERGFFGGKFRIVSGADFSDQGYKGNSSEIIIPKWFADEYHLSVGDAMCYYFDTIYYRRFEVTNCIKGVVSGIYENTENPLSHTENHIYIPLQFLMRAGVYINLGQMVSDGLLGGDFRVARADFVLRDREAFEGFAENAVKNGIDTNKIDIVFNNAEYDMIRNGLMNVRVVVLIVVAIVSAAGLGIMITYTVNTIMSREKERQMLRSVGMARKSIALMLFTELLAVLIIALPLGYISGRLVSNGICRYADGMVENDIEELNLLNNSNTSVDELILPLSCNVKMSISDGTVETSSKSYAPYRPSEGGIDVRIADIYNSNAANYTEAKTSVWTPLKLVAADVEDISPLVVEDHAQEFIDSGMYLDYTLLTYVPRSSGYEVGEGVLGIANRIHMEHTTVTGLVQPMYLLVCGYFDDDLLGLDGDVFFTTEQEFLKTKRQIYIEILPHCDMVIPSAEGK